MSRVDSSSGDHIGLEYSDEPLADEDLLAEYHQQEKECLDAVRNATKMLPFYFVWSGIIGKARFLGIFRLEMR